LQYRLPGACMAEGRWVPSSASALAEHLVQIFYGCKPTTWVEADSIGKRESPARVAVAINRALVIELY